MKVVVPDAVFTSTSTTSSPGPPVTVSGPRPVVISSSPGPPSAVTGKLRPPIANSSSPWSSVTWMRSKSFVGQKTLLSFAGPLGSPNP